MQRRIGELDVVLGLQPVGLALLLHQVTLGDVQLLELGVASDADDLHAVLQRPRDALEGLFAVVMNITFEPGRSRCRGSGR